MFRRKLRNRLIDPGPHLAPLQSLVGQWLSARDGFRGWIDFSQLIIVIEFRPASFDLFFAEPIDRHIHHNPIEPGIKRRLPAKAIDRFPRFHEAVLSKIPGILFVMDHVVNHSKNSGSVAYYELIKCRAVTFLAPFYQLQFGDIGLSHKRFRLHNWTEAQRFNSFNPESLRSRSAVAIRSDIPLSA